MSPFANGKITTTPLDNQIKRRTKNWWKEECTDSYKIKEEKKNLL